MKKNIIVIVLLILCTFNLPSSGQAHRQGQLVVTRTRLQVVFGELEGQWLKAIQGKDETTLNRILADEFSLWTPAPPGSPVPRTDWQTAAFGRKLQSFGMRQLAVRSVTPEISVANFELSETFDQGGVPRTEEHFVVDVWVKSGEGDNWRCTDRYDSRLSTFTRPMTSQPGVKPDGKN